MKILAAAITIYAVVAVFVFAFHIVFLQMIQIELAAARAAVWPVFWATGWPHGTPMRMD